MTNTYLATSPSISDEAVLEEAATEINRRLLLAILRETPEIVQHALKWQLPHGQVMLISLPVSKGILSIVLEDNPGFDISPAATEAVYIASDGTTTGITPNLLLQALTELWELTPEVGSRLQAEVTDNLRNMETALLWEKTNKQQRLEAVSSLLSPKSKIAQRRQDLIQSEQLPLKGHPIHIGAKTKIGFSAADVAQYSPEFGREVPLHIVGVRRSLVKEYGNAAPWNQYIDRCLPAADQENFCYFPVHPWQLEHIILPEFAAPIANGDIVNTGITIPAWPTLSFRTLAAVQQEGLPYYHFKLPVHIQATSGTRVLSPRAVNNSLLLSGMVRDILQTAPGMRKHGRIAADLYGAHFQVSPDLSFMLRNDPAEESCPEETIVVTAALTHTSSQITTPLILSYLQHSGADTESFLSSLFDALLTFPIRLFLEYGIAAEAHAQNALLVLDNEHMPVSLCLRDMSGIRCSGEHPYIQERAHLFVEGERIIRNYEEAAAKLIHSLYYSLTGELVAVISKHGNVPAASIWAAAKSATQITINNSNAPQTDKQRLSALLFAATVQVKALTRMRVTDKSVDYLYMQVPNPMHENNNS